MTFRSVTAQMYPDWLSLGVPEDRGREINYLDMIIKHNNTTRPHSGIPSCTTSEKQWWQTDLSSTSFHTLSPCWRADASLESLQVSYIGMLWPAPPSQLSWCLQWSYIQTTLTKGTVNGTPGATSARSCDGTCHTAIPLVYNKHTGGVLANRDVEKMLITSNCC